MSLPDWLSPGAKEAIEQAKTPADQIIARLDETRDRSRKLNVRSVRKVLDDLEGEQAPQDPLDAARKVRAQRVAAEIWVKVELSVKLHACRCKLKPGMSLFALRALGAGCTRPYYICPSLDKYRRLLGH